jgi:excisionase family DNA binding protein
VKNIENEADPLLKLREVEEELNVSRNTLHRWIKSGRLVAVRVGQQWRVRRSVVEEMKGDVT